jgi:hypothetical protein
VGGETRISTGAPIVKVATLIGLEETLGPKTFFSARTVAGNLANLPSKMSTDGGGYWIKFLRRLPRADKM